VLADTDAPVGERMADGLAVTEASGQT